MSAMSVSGQSTPPESLGIVTYNSISLSRTCILVTPLV